MAFIEMNCGPCESSIQVDSTDNEWLDGMLTLLAQRFVDGHVKCGFVTPVVNTDQGVRSGNVVRMKTRKVDIEEEGDSL